jgi:hypothetical protein
MKKSRGRRTSNVRLLSPSEHEAALRLFAVISQMPLGSGGEAAGELCELFDRPATLPAIATCEAIGAALSRQESEEENP